MSFDRIEKIKNGSEVCEIVIYKCDVTGEGLPENHPRFNLLNDCHISTDGFEILLDQWVNRMKGNCITPYILSDLLDRHTKTNKRSTYINKNIVKSVLLKYKHTCFYCGSKEKLEIDHIIPVVKGGKNIYSNLQVLCRTCNRKKGGKYNG
jgi:hypothetical protein